MNYKKYENWIATFFQDPGYILKKELYETKNGDCFFSCISQAFLCFSAASIKSQREYLSLKANKKLFDNYLYMYETYQSELEKAIRNKNYQKYNEIKPLLEQYLFMQNILNVKDLKEFMLKPDYWANSVAIKWIEEYFNIKLIIMDECSKSITSGESQNEGFKSKFFIILNWKNKNHFQLVEYKNITRFQFTDLPFLLSATCISKFGLNNFIGDLELSLSKNKRKLLLKMIKLCKRISTNMNEEFSILLQDNNFLSMISNSNLKNEFSHDEILAFVLSFY